MGILLGCVADDFTGATDIANTLVSRGMRTIQTIGVPADRIDPGDAEAAVVALKSRTAPRDDAIRDSLAALQWLRDQGAQQFIFKYCSTFDSTEHGNIGPVADALLDSLGESFTLVCPAFPAAGRTVYQGHLFIHDTLLSESSMRDHPLTPMTDANLVRFLGRQTRHAVGLIPSQTVAEGCEAIAAACATLRTDGYRFAVVDALCDRDLQATGAAAAALRLVTGGSGIAAGLVENFRDAGLLSAPAAPRLPDVVGRSAVLAGSCSAATRAQVALAGRRLPTRAVDPRAIARGESVVKRTLEWAEEQSPDEPLLIHSCATPEAITGIQHDLGRRESGELVERAFGSIAKGLIERGVRRLIVAGGETSGAVVSALNVQALRIGPQIDPGVPWTEAVGEPALAMALKSGNFGSEDFFAKAFGMLP